MAGFLSLGELFEGRHFDREVIVLCVRWYLRFKLSFSGTLVEMWPSATRGAHAFQPGSSNPSTGSIGILRRAPSGGYQKRATTKGPLIRTITRRVPLAQLPR